MSTESASLQTGGQDTGSTRSSRPIGLTAKLIEARKRVTGISKDSRNTHGQYDYVSAEQMISSTRRALNDVGLLFLRSTCAIRDSSSIPVLEQNYVLTDMDSGESMTMYMELPCPDRKGQPPDKAVLAALTSGLNYVIRDLLLLPRGMDELGKDPGELDSIDDREWRAKELFGKAKAMFPGEVVLDTTEKLTNEVHGLLEAIAASPVAPQDAEKLWVSSASKWVERETGRGHEFKSLRDIPRAFAEQIVARYRAEYSAWRRNAAGKEAA